jgi:hypothetical protein
VRVIIRFTINSDTGSVLRNTLRGVLQGFGFVRTGPSLYDATAITSQQLGTALTAFWGLINNPPVGTDPLARLNHFWMYADGPYTPTSQLPPPPTIPSGAISQTPPGS